MDRTSFDSSGGWSRARNATVVQGMEMQRSGRYAESLDQLDLLLNEDLSKLERAWVLDLRVSSLAT